MAASPPPPRAPDAAPAHAAGLTPRHAVTTPEGVTFRRRPAELPSRARAWLIDQAVVLAFKVAAVIALAAWGGVGMALVYIVSLGLDFDYYTLSEWRWGGQTLGKKAMGLRVAAVNGAWLDGGEILLRNLVRAIDGLPMFMVVGGLVALCDPHRRRLGDLVAGTLVIREPAGVIPAAVFATDDAPASLDPALRARLQAALRREDRDLLLDLAQRRDALAPLARADLFAAAAVYYRERFHLPTAEHLTDERFVLNLARAACDG